jgi:hypothetical protein
MCVCKQVGGCVGERWWGLRVGVERGGGRGGREGMVGGGGGDGVLA